MTRFLPLASLVIVLMLASCASTTQPYPIGVGRDADALKRSECACKPVSSGWVL
jgi:hypothetical protein